MDQKKKNRFSLMLLVVFIFLDVPLHALYLMEKEGWKLVMDKNDIKSNIRQYKGTCVFEFKTVTLPSPSKR